MARTFTRSLSTPPEELGGIDALDSRTCRAKGRGQLGLPRELIHFGSSRSATAASAAPAKPERRLAGTATPVSVPTVRLATTVDSLRRVLTQ